MQPNDFQQADPYAFLNETKKPKHLPNLRTSGSLKIKLILGLIVLLILLIVFAFIKSVLSSSQVNTASLYSVMSEQQELINLATLGTSQSSNPINQDLAATVTGVITTDQSNLIKLLEHNHIKVNTSLFVLQPNINNQLQQVQQSSSFDPQFITTMQQQFNYYKTDLSAAYNQNSNSIIKHYLATDYKHITLIMKIISNQYS